MSFRVQTVGFFLLWFDDGEDFPSDWAAPRKMPSANICNYPERAR